MAHCHNKNHMVLMRTTVKKSNASKSCSIDSSQGIIILLAMYFLGIVVE